MRSKFLAVLLLLGVAAGVSGLEVQKGKLKLIVNERSGRFSLFQAEDQVKPVWTPLFLTDDPTTTKWKLRVGERVYVLGDDGAFTTDVQTTATGVKVVWTSKTIVATLAYDFMISTSSTIADGLKLTLWAVNVSDANVKLGVRFVFDTNLGEKKDHFKTSAGETLSSETKWEGGMPDFWVSPSPADDQIGLLVMTGKGATVPSRVIFANWRRLDDSPWDLAFKQGRDFNLLPYSFNDSAVAQYYDAQDLAPSATREVSVVLGLRSAKTMEGARPASANPLDDLLKKGQDPSLGALEQDLVSLQALMGQIDAKLADPNRVTSEDLKLLKAVLDQIEARRKTLEATKP